MSIEEVSHMLTISKEAAAILKAAKAAQGAEDGAGIRIRGGVTPETPGKLTVALQIKEEPDPGDEEYEQEGLRIFVEEALVEPLDGRTLDVRDALEGPEFIFR
jgi:Fe-S cluster assembly iron-binding protein IscA